MGHVKVTKDILKKILRMQTTKINTALTPGNAQPQEPLLQKHEWEMLGIELHTDDNDNQWEHYGCHKPEQHILLFRRRRANSSVEAVGEIDQCPHLIPVESSMEATGEIDQSEIKS